MDDRARNLFEFVGLILLTAAAVYATVLLTPWEWTVIVVAGGLGAALVAVSQLTKTPPGGAE